MDKTPSVIWSLISQLGRGSLLVQRLSWMVFRWALDIRLKILSNFASYPDFRGCLLFLLRFVQQNLIPRGHECMNQQLVFSFILLQSDSSESTDKLCYPLHQLQLPPKIGKFPALSCSLVEDSWGQVFKFFWAYFCLHFLKIYQLTSIHFCWYSFRCGFCS